MKTKNISKLLMMLLGVIALSIAFTSCNDDDDDKKVTLESQLIGKWYWEKDIVNGTEDINDEFECSTQKDYSEFLPAGKVMHKTYNEKCQEEILEGSSWKLESKTLTLIDFFESDETDIFTIKNITENIIELHYEKVLENGKEIMIDWDDDDKKDDITIFFRKIK